MSQTWNRKIECITGKKSLKTIKFNQNTLIKINSYSYDVDSVKHFSVYEGYFRTGSIDSIGLKMKSYRNGFVAKSGSTITTSYPEDYFKKNQSAVSIMQVAVNDIQNLDYRQKGPIFKGLDNAIVAEFYISIAAAIVSPLLCINYKEGTFNADRYKYLGTASAAGLTLGLGYIAVTNSHIFIKEYRFKGSNPPVKKEKVWKFL